MFIHVVLMTLRPGVTETQLFNLSDRVRELAAMVAGPGSCLVGPNVTEEPFGQGYDYGFAIRFPARTTLDAYHVNPAHLPVSLAIRDLASTVLVFDLAG